ncbi:MAG TPA: hypothetical protein VGX76_19985, partial [Pirellulales bacterium]|nr:hypothetical protein [Pirellulales bacterium]
MSVPFPFPDSVTVPVTVPEVMRLWRKWLSRRKRRGSISWVRFDQILKVLVLPWPRGWAPP